MTEYVMPTWFEGSQNIGDKKKATEINAIAFLNIDNPISYSPELNPLI